MNDLDLDGIETDLARPQVRPLLADPLGAAGAGPVTRLVAAVPGLVAALRAEIDCRLEAERLLREAVGAIRALHVPTTVEALDGACFRDKCGHDDECPEIEVTVCRECLGVFEDYDPEMYPRGVVYPCATIRALDAAAANIVDGNAVSVNDPQPAVHDLADPLCSQHEPERGDWGHCDTCAQVGGPQDNTVEVQQS